jgi:putative sterol carrier protein
MRLLSERTLRSCFSSTMADATAQFFEELDQRGHEPMLAGVTGTIRFDVAEGKRTERWLVVIERGAVSVSRRNTKADCVVRTDRALLDRLVRGQANALASFLRGAMTLEGPPELVLAFQRLFPGPRPRANDAAASVRRRR